MLLLFIVGVVILLIPPFRIVFMYLLGIAAQVTIILLFWQIVFYVGGIT